VDVCQDTQIKRRQDRVVLDRDVSQGYGPDIPAGRLLEVIVSADLSLDRHESAVSATSYWLYVNFDEFVAHWFYRVSCYTHAYLRDIQEGGRLQRAVGRWML